MVNDDTQIIGRYPEREGMKRVSNPGAWSGEWVSEEGNKMTLNYGYVLQIVGQEYVGKVMFSLKSSGIKIGQAWNNLLDRKLPSGQTAATYHQVFTLKSKIQTKGSNSWYVVEPNFKSWVNQEQYDSAFEVTKTLIPASEQLKVEDKSSDTETDTKEKVDY